MATKHKPRVNEHAEVLKKEGNDLHLKGQYKAAYRKYSEAIKIDSKNAIYYANRAASSLELKECVDFPLGFRSFDAMQLQIFRCSSGREEGLQNYPYLLRLCSTTATSLS